VWTWDTFDYLDVTRQAILGETCKISGSCMSHILAADGNDWTHGNAVRETPDGNLLFSTRHQDWVIKINYDLGKGDGHLIWRLGKDGDFLFQSDDDYPWFSHQHDANFLSDNSTLALFDNGNTRRVANPGANSRGQVIRVDEKNRTVTSVLSQDLGVFSTAVGSAQNLANGNYSFDAGFVNNNSAISFEVDQTGRTVRSLKADTLEYRTFRLSSLYSGLQ
jgi:arylsulfate sulfotransferase